MKSKPVAAVFFSAVLVGGCASGPPRLTPEPVSDLQLRLEGPVDVLTLGGEDIGSRNTSMVAAAGLYLTVPQGQPIAWGEGLRKLYGENLAQSFEHSNVAPVVRFAGDGNLKAKGKDVLEVVFVQTFRGEDGWPTRLKVQYLLESSGKIVFNETYEASATLVDGFGCMDCAPFYIAFQKLNDQLFPALNKLNLTR